MSVFAIFIIFIVVRGEINQRTHLRVRCVDFVVIFVFLLCMHICTYAIHLNASACKHTYTYIAVYLRTHGCKCVCALCPARLLTTFVVSSRTCQCRQQ